MKDDCRFFVNFEVNRLKHTFVKDAKIKIAEELKRREMSILSPEKVVEKYYKGEIECLYNGTKHLFVYMDDSGLSKESCLHFYDESGQFLWSYPWNGEIERYKMFTCPFNDVSKLFGRLDIKFIEGNKIVITEYSHTHKFNSIKRDESTKTMFDTNGKKLFAQTCKNINGINKDL